MFFNRNSTARLQDRENGVRYEKAARGLEADIEWPYRIQYKIVKH